MQYEPNFPIQFLGICIRVNTSFVAILGLFWLHFLLSYQSSKIMITGDKKIKFLKGSFSCCLYSLYLTLRILISSTYFGIFPLDYRLTGVKLALIVFYKFCIELNVIHGLWIVPSKVQIKLWSTLASLWNSDLKISIPASESFSSFWKWKPGSTSVS